MTHLEQLILDTARRTAESVVDLFLSRSVAFPEYLDTKTAARYLGCNRQQLEALRSKGGGPLFIRFGRLIRYKRSDLDGFMAKHRVSSTSEADERRRGRRGNG